MPHAPQAQAQVHTYQPYQPACGRPGRHPANGQRSTANGHFLEAFSSLPHAVRASKMSATRLATHHAGVQCTYVRTSTTRTYIASGLDRGVFSDDVMASLLRDRAVCWSPNFQVLGRRTGTVRTAWQPEWRVARTVSLPNLSQLDLRASRRAAR